jgi:methionyl-tRNA formyltransferase
MTSAVVFAYHNVGARCLRVLLAHGIEVSLVVTHEDDPRETLWFERVADVAARHGLACATPEDPNIAEFVARIATLGPQFVFSFYYRRMLGPLVLALPTRGALNMHGSLLPRYRGRAPVNWAVLHGERETGATLHYMVEKPDAGDIVAQQAVPILPDDTAKIVFDKVTVAAEIVLDGALPALIAGKAPRHRQDLAQGSYFGGRKPEDGRIDWSANAPTIHNLVRAVAPPFPGALTTISGAPARVLATRVLERDRGGGTPEMRADGMTLRAICGGGGTLAIDALEVDGEPIDAAAFVRRFGARAPLL